MTTSTRGNAGLNLPEVPWTADLMVVILVVVALLGAWAIRGQQLSATMAGGIGGLRLAVPADSLVVSGDEGYLATTPAGLTVAARELPLAAVSPIVGESPTGNLSDTLTLAASSWALNQAVETSLFRVLESRSINLGGQAAIIQEYLYVETDNTSLYSNQLEVIHGYGLITINAGKPYLVSLEAPDEHFDEVESFWPRLLSSIRFA